MEFNKTLNEIQRGTEIEGFYILKNAQSKITSAGKPFLNMVLSDRSGEMKAVIWDYTGPINEDDEGKIIKIRGVVTEFNGTLQITAEKLRRAMTDDKFNIALLIPTAPIDIEKTYQYVVDTIESITDYDYRKICQIMLEEHKEDFKKIPAAKSVHHAFIGGLLMHTSTMLKSAEMLAEIYSDIIDRNLLIAGALLHDIAKIYEFSFSEYGLVSEYSTKGQLLGHLVMGQNEVSAKMKAEGLDEKKALLLGHMLLSHHGEPDFGAAVVPMCAEAELLSFIDNIDSKMEIYRETFEKIGVGEFSPRVFALEKRVFKHQ